jgi:PIN domain nuclease of toxin-antitoxin system
MKVLLDTHCLIWWFNGYDQLSPQALHILENPEYNILVSAASAWEMAIKIKLGKLHALPLMSDLSRHITEEGFTEESITIEHAVRAGLLPLHHRDPFDRLLVAQAQALNVPMLSADEILDKYDVKRIW